jgi:hypothetical protein
MRTFKMNALFAATVIASMTTSIHSLAQATSVASPTPSIDVKIAMEKDQVPAGGSPILIMTETNKSDRDVPVHTELHNYHLLIKGEKGEAPLTEFHRHLRGEWLPGDGPDLRADEMALTMISPGESGTLKFDLTRFYDLSRGGRYTVNVGAREQSSDNYISSNTVSFEILIPNQ